MSARTALGHRPLRIHEVADLTGVPEPTLRAWERRYGIPMPERTASRYRMYQSRDIDEVRAMRRLTQEGIAAAQAARHVVQNRGDLRASDGERDPSVLLRDAIVDAASRLDGQAMERTLREALVSGSAIQILDEVFAPALRIVGEKWHAGKASVAEEHFVTHRIARAVGDLLRLASGSGPRVVLASIEGENHDLGLLAFAVKAATWGAEPLFLGANVPPLALRSAVKSSAPRLVALSVTRALEPKRARKVFATYGRACGDCAWIVGGLGARAMEKAIAREGGVVAPEQNDSLRKLLHDLLRRGAA